MIRVETKHLFREGVSPQIKSLILKRRAGITLTEREKKKLNCFNESVSMVSPTALHNRIVKPPQPIEEPKTFDELDMDDEIDLEEILKEMDYGEDEEDEFEKELDEVFNELHDVKLSKGWKEARKLVDKLRRDTFKKLNDDELEEFMGVLKTSFGFK
jgi:hypothetical protein